MDNNITEVVKKKRGRKPKNYYSNEETVISIPVVSGINEKKKRGRKKKYEIENFEKILNRDHLNNFNHNIAYSDDELDEVKLPSCIKKISFGNLDITVSKKNDPVIVYKDLIQKVKESECSININEYSSDEEPEILDSNCKEIIEIIAECDNEKFYKENKKYISEINEKIKEQSLRKLRIVTTLKNVIYDHEWPQNCDVCCWWCCHKFECSPCTLPFKYDALRKRFLFMGIFCSWNCTKAYNFEKNDHRKDERSCLITLLLQQLYGITNAINIKPSPMRQCLKMFGGYMDIDEFRNKCHTVDSFRINLLNFNFIYPEITEVSNIKIKKENKNLRLQRS